MRIPVLILVLAVLLLAAAGPAAAQRPAAVKYLGARYISPTDPFDEAYDWGYGLVGGGQNRSGQYTSIILEGGWYRIQGKDGPVEGLSVPDASIFSMLLGGALTLSSLDLGVKGGYFFGDEDEWDVMPFAQAVVRRFAIGVEYKALGDTRWVAGYVNLLF